MPLFYKLFLFLFLCIKRQELQIHYNILYDIVYYNVLYDIVFYNLLYDIVILYYILLY